MEHFFNVEGISAAATGPFINVLTGDVLAGLTPEPSSMLLMGSGLVMMGGMCGGGNESNKEVACDHVETDKERGSLWRNLQRLFVPILLLFY